MSGAEADQLLADLKDVYHEQHRYRDPEQMQVRDDVLALGVLLRREIAASNRTSSLASLRPRDLDRISRHDPNAPE